MTVGKRRRFSMSSYRITAALVCSPLLVGQVMAQESGGLSGFRTPTNNIHCMLNDFEPTPDNPISLRCDIRETDNRLPRRPRSCDLEWGTTFAIATEGRRGELWCVGDTTFDEKHTVLEYGHFCAEGGLHLSVRAVRCDLLQLQDARFLDIEDSPEAILSSGELDFYKHNQSFISWSIVGDQISATNETQA